MPNFYQYAPYYALDTGGAIQPLMGLQQTLVRSWFPSGLPPSEQVGGLRHVVWHVQLSSHSLIDVAARPAMRRRSGLRQRIGRHSGRELTYGARASARRQSA